MQQHDEPTPEDLEDPDELARYWMARSMQAGDPFALPPEQRDAWLAGYHAGRAAGLEDGYAEGYAACDAEIARLHRAAVWSTRRADPFPCMEEGEE